MKNFVASHRSALLAALQNTPGHALTERLTWDVDTIVLEALASALAATMGAYSGGLAASAHSGGLPALPERWALMALGGYGRNQMCLRSDVDLQLVLPDGAADPQPLMEVFLDHLTRRGLKLGHGVRTVTEALMLAREEPTFATAALTARHLAGDPSTTEAVRSPVYQHLAGPGLLKLLEFVTADRQKRSERLGDTVFVLEPDLKHGIGGLRDAQLVGWLALVTGRPFDRRVAFAEDLLIRVRLALHALVTFKCDRLSLDYQDQVAAALGYQGHEEVPAEHLMRDVHLALRVLSSRARRHLEVASHRLSTPRRMPLVEHPNWVRVHGALGGDRLARIDGAAPRTIREAAAALRVTAATGLPLEADIENGFEDLADHLAGLEPGSSGLGMVTGSADRPRPELAALLLELFLDPGQGASLALHSLHRSGLLIALVPEFRAVLGRVQRDLYHVYTVDEHTMRALDKLKALMRADGADQPELDLAISRIQALSESTRRALCVATFLHDLGKGYGSGHHERGAELAAIIGPRLGLTHAEVKVVLLLVRHQADMPMICLRRDLADPRPIRGLARLVCDVETLDALYLLSIADWSSVGPLAFSSWQHSLLNSLYLKTRDHLLEPGLYADPRGIADAQRLALVSAELGEIPQLPGAHTDPIDDFCSALPTRYFQRVDLATMQRHFRLWRRHQAENHPQIHLHHEPTLAQAVVTIVCDDAPGVLAQLTGALAEAGADVISAEIVSLSAASPEALHTERVVPGHEGDAMSGAVLDVFRIADPHGRFAGVRGQQTIEKAVGRALAGAPPERRKAESFGPASALPPVRPEVRVDNEAATGHSVIDVLAADRAGLLHDLAQFFHEERASVDLAFVTTEGRVAHDSFYVVDRAGRLFDETALNAMSARLLTRLAEPPRLPQV